MDNLTKLVISGIIAAMLTCSVIIFNDTIFEYLSLVLSAIAWVYFGSLSIKEKWGIR